MQKRSGQVLEGLVEKDVKSNGWPRPSAFVKFKSFGHDDLTCYFGCLRPPDVDGIKMLYKDDQGHKTLRYN